MIRATQLNNDLPQSTEDLLVQVPVELISAIMGAVLRLGYLYPHLRFEMDPDGIRARGEFPADVDMLRRDIFHTVYREKIYIETLPLRSAFYDAVLRPCTPGL